MKRAIFIILFFLIYCYGNSYSQSLTISKNGTQKSNGDTVQFWGTMSGVTAFNIVPKNISNSTVTIKCKKEVLYTTSDSDNYFCFAGNCYSFTTIISPSSCKLAPGASVSDTFEFSGHYTPPKGKTDSCSVRYTFFNVSNTNDTIALTVIYRVHKINAIDTKSDIIGINAYPNPADKYSLISYNFNKEYNSAKIILRDLYGREVYSVNITRMQGIISIPTSSLLNGFYICSIMADNNVANKILVIQH